MSSALKLNRTLFFLFKGLTFATVYGTLSKDPEHPITRNGLQYPGLHNPATEREPFPQFNLLDPSTVPTTIETDVVIVGTGAGGGTVAAVLAQAGYRVLVVDKGQWTGGAQDNEDDGVQNMYDRGGLLTSDDASIAILAGSTIGGGTAVNWAASLRPQHWLREEWAKEHGLKYFLTPEYQRALDVVCDRIGVSTGGIVHNVPNSILRRGCEKLGMHVADIPQNTRNKKHDCGGCGFGCATATKQSSAATWLVDACKAGAQVLPECHVRKVVVDGKSVARGIEAVVRGRTVQIKARKVVVAAGSIQSPALLLRSGLTNAHIGKHLGLHPVAMIMAKFNEPVNPWSGAMMTVVSNASEKCGNDGSHYGVKLESTTLHPLFTSFLIPWRTPEQHKVDMSQLKYTAPVLSLSRDRDRRAYITLDEDNEPLINFDLSPFDEASVVEGAIRAAEVLVAAGARSVFTTQPDVPEFHVPSDLKGVHDERFVAWKECVKSVGMKPLRSPLFSAHQMGTCRMGTSPAKSVCNPRGESWEAKGLYVADASLFPSSSGVNPMVTTYSMAYSVAQFIVQDDKHRPIGAAKL
ncbi:hypothetical protein BCR44DRAFT_1105062 [Catenaria anguillulae PL171]|uniref:Long-chain-alcohol oxidase n=1 Tax=Catenaria anguillulae PL171 TaxID=765915 RepID=A0A1Y2I2I3_9FUNG|nr:hypothetical protein BCR44DRAFT_1105062 [Catenaria anguillulae PL171]